VVANELCHQLQPALIEQTAPAASVSSRSGRTGQTAAQQHFLDKGETDAELARQLAARSRAFVAGLRDLGAQIRRVGFHVQTLLSCRSTAN